MNRLLIGLASGALFATFTTNTSGWSFILGLASIFAGVVIGAEIGPFINKTQNKK